MNIPSFDLTHIANPDGTVHPKAQIFFDQLISFMQKNFSSEGYKLPQQPTTIITDFLNTPLSIGGYLYNSTTGKGMINEAGTYKTITTS